MTPNPNFFKKRDKVQDSFDNTENDLVDDTDDCIICGKLLLKHSEYDSNQCLSITKKLLFKKQLSKRRRKA